MFLRVRFSTRLGVFMLPYCVNDSSCSNCLSCSSLKQTVLYWLLLIKSPISGFYRRRYSEKTRSLFLDLGLSWSHSGRELPLVLIPSRAPDLIGVTCGSWDVRVFWIARFSKSIFNFFHLLDVPGVLWEISKRSQKVSSDPQLRITLTTWII